MWTDSCNQFPTSKSLSFLSFSSRTTSTLHFSIPSSTKHLTFFIWVTVRLYKQNHYSINIYVLGQTIWQTEQTWKSSGQSVSNLSKISWGKASLSPTGSFFCKNYILSCEISDIITKCQAEVNFNSYGVFTKELKNCKVTTRLYKRALLTWKPGLVYCSWFCIYTSLNWDKIYDIL